MRVADDVRLLDLTNQGLCSIVIEIDRGLIMAKGLAGKSGGTPRVRLVVIEAEIADGSDLSQFTQVMQNALRGPTPTVVKRIAAPTSHANGGASAAEAELVEEAALEEEIEAIDVTPVAPKAKAPRKPASKPSVIPIDITSEPPLSSLGDPKSNHKRYLKIAAWLHDHRGIEAVTANHIYTCYRHLGWPIDLSISPSLYAS